MLPIAIALYLISVFLLMLAVYSRRLAGIHKEFYRAFPLLFVFAEALYVLPLSIRSLVTKEIEGNLSPYLPLFEPYLPYAVLMCAAFNVAFIFVYRYSGLRIAVPVKVPTKKSPLIGILVLIGICYVMIYQLAASFGGIANFILIGYKVTEQFSAAGQYAVAFDWLTAASIVLLYYGYINRLNRYILFGMAFVGTLAVAFAIMGRRADLIVLIGAAVAGRHFLFKRLTVKILGACVVALFLFLNFIGFTRGESYNSFSDVVSVISEKNENLQQNRPSVFYAITTGNFAVPFETFPQVIRTVGADYPYGFGLYSLRAFVFVIPAFLWADRPLPLSNWYMQEFYGETEKNIGRQFFFLTAPYMDYGPFGIIAFGVLIAGLLLFAVRSTIRNVNDPIIAAFWVLFLTNVLNFMSTDTLGFIVVFLKSVGIPILFLYVCRALVGLKK